MVSGYEWNSANIDTQSQLLPINFIRGGRYVYSSGNITNRSSYGYYWQSRIYSDTYARYLTFNSTYLVPQNNSTKGDGFTVRCLVR